MRDNLAERSGASRCKRPGLTVARTASKLWELRRATVLLAMLFNLDVEASCLLRRQRVDRSIGLDGYAPLPHRVAEPVDKGLKSAAVVARGGVCACRPWPRTRPD